jgi:ATP-binding cassette subfamily B protein
VVYEQYQEQEARLSSMLQENISAIRIVRAFARHKFEISKFEKENWQKYQRGRQFLMLHSFYWPTSDILCTIQMLLIFFLGAGMAISGEISLGTYLAVSSMVIWIIWPMRNLGRVVIQASSALVSYRRVSRILGEEPEDFRINREVRPLQIKGQVDFSGVSFEYRAGEGVLHEVSFSCKPGQIIALLGKAGSGKTTLVNLLPRFYDYTGGSLMLDGRELTSYPLHSLRSQIGIVEQEPFLFSRTIRQNIIYGAGREVSQQEIEEAARAAAIHEVIMSFPEGYNTPVGERGVTLSGGQKQRLAIARTILKNPRILILDDATSSVDSETEELIQRALSRLMEGRSSFIIAHRVQTVMRADKILVLEQGRIVQEGIHRVLIQEEGFYKQIFDLQFAEMA